MIIKANTEGLCVLLNAIVNALAYPQSNGIAEVFDGDAEYYQVLVQQTSTHEKLAPIPYQEEHEPK
ncbi:hypothetical protein [Nostoc sp. LEGE 06077]|uniref:hypothetical protein n=1 Tax=Nostoc sp. LEGE 06077 TaxID=915325 RepID=UPI001D156B69|nr:hypothetical protein [Nostoc sp. LEGE 06077]